MLQLCILVLYSITTVLHFINAMLTFNQWQQFILNLSTKHVLPSPYSPTRAYTTVTSYY